MIRLHRASALAAAAMTLVVLVAWPVDAFRHPVQFSVLNDGVGTTTLPNDVRLFSPDGPHVFASGAVSPGGWPDATNLMAVPGPNIGLPDSDEIDALSPGDDLVLLPSDVQQGAQIEFYFSIDLFAAGVPGPWPPDVASEAPRAAGDVYFAWPIFWPYGGNHLGIPEAIVGLDPPTPDDLDALVFSMEISEPVRFPVYFSVDRASCGFNGTAVWVQCNSPAPPAQAADVFLSYGNSTNVLFANEAMMGLDWNADNIDAMALWDWGPQGIPNGEVDPGLDWIYFSVDWLTNGLQGTAVNFEALNGNIQGDIFFSDFTGMNWKVLDGSQLGLLEPIPPQPFTPDEDNLNALETEWWSDIDGDQVPDIVDNCPGTPNPMQQDTLQNGIGDACDPTGVELGEAGDATFGIRTVEPNPFTDATVVRFTLPEATNASIEVFSVDGRRLRRLADGPRPAGAQFVVWDGRDEDGQPVSAGVYWVRLSSGERTTSSKVVRVN